MNELEGRIYGDLSYIESLIDDTKHKQLDSGHITLQPDGHYELCEFQGGFAGGFVNLAKQPSFSEVRIFFEVNVEAPGKPDELESQIFATATLRVDETAARPPIWPFEPIYAPLGGKIVIKHISGPAFPIYYQVYVR